MRQRGFTIIELILAIGFVSILLLAVSVLTIRVGDMYEKGATVRSMNQVGREVMDTMRRDIQSSTGVEFEVITSGGYDIYTLCLGSVSYVANEAVALQAREDAGNLTDLAVVERSPVPVPAHLVRVVDKTRAYCGEDSAELVKAVDASADELLTSDSSQLAVHDMNVDAIVEREAQSLYRVSLVIGTNASGTIDTNNRCRVSSTTPGDEDADYNYCSVAELTTIMRTGGEA